ncbi:MAG: hypothetical protein M3417_04470 [Actinomycetota bacterium]|nr:hypothetical protein [Actinomycetota bacterium]
MDLWALNRRLSEALVAFAWDEWAQMGVSAATQRRSPWAQDPEALIVFTLEIARDDPRLFDELLDWLVVSESLLSVRRLRAMCVDDTDTALTEGALAWLDRQRPRSRLRPGRQAARARDALEPLFRPAGVVPTADEDFAAAGLLRSSPLASGKSRAPHPTAPINLAFRLRHILGVGIRAEIVRVLLTTADARVTAQTLAQSTGYAKRNVHDALTGLTTAGVVSAVAVRAEQRYAADRAAWAALLGSSPVNLPTHRDWPQLLAVLRRILRWSAQPELVHASAYLGASRARDLLDSLRPDLAFVGIAVGATPNPAGAWDDLDEVVDRTLAMLDVSVPAQR